MPSSVTSSATVVWEGSVARGSGTVTGASGTLGPVPFDLPTRIGETAGKSTPEELLAAAHAACFSTALGSILAGAKTPAETLTITSTVTLDMTGRPGIPLLEVHATGVVPGVDAATFAAAVREAEDGCLISRVLMNGQVRIASTASLD
jgi:osmotically inducible protein OsmC